jgi:hypothetical protein
MNKRIAFDIDGVIYSWTRYAFNYALEHHYAYPDESIEHFFGYEEEHSEIFWFNLVREISLYYKAPMKKEYVELLNKFKDSGWIIFYLTNRPDCTKTVTYNWLEDSGAPFLQNLYFTEKKSSIIRCKEIDYHIDDRGKCIDDVKNFCPSFLVNNFWNSEYKEPSNCKRISNLLEVEELLNGS